MPSTPRGAAQGTSRHCGWPAETSSARASRPIATDWLPSTSERSAAADAVAAATAVVAQATAERDAGNAERDRLRADLLERERTRGGAASRLTDLERDAQAAALEAQRHEDELTAIGRERDLAIESLPTGCRGHRSGRPEDAVPLTADAEATLEAIQEELGKVRRTLSQIGSVNPFAIDEHRELAGRLETLVARTPTSRPRAPRPSS